MDIDLNTEDTDEYKNWLALLAEIGRIQGALKDNPNKMGLKLARSHAYNLLADIQSLLDLEDVQLSSADANDEQVIETDRLL